MLPGLMLERKGGSRVAPVSSLSPAECEAQQSPTPHSTQGINKLQSVWKSLDSRASTPPLLPIPVGTDPQTSLTSWAEEPLRAHSCFLSVTAFCDMVANSELATNTGCACASSGAIESLRQTESVDPPSCAFQTLSAHCWLLTCLVDWPFLSLLTH